MKSGFAGIIGRPNVGKSTLLNSILGEKIAITTDKPQTTRNSIRGIYTEHTEDGDSSQIVFIDTPGIHKAHNKLGAAMDDIAIKTYKEVDVILFLVDGSPDKGRGDTYILDMIKDVKTPKFLVINKVDTMDPEEFKETYDVYEKKGYLEEGPMFFPEDMVTDHPERFIVSEIIREKLLMYLNEEVPHGVAVEIESYKEDPKLTEIGAVIYCERKSHKGIIIGKQGKKLKGIGKSARLEIEALLGVRVYLQLFVKVKENWRDSDFAISNFGYSEDR